MEDREAVLAALEALHEDSLAAPATLARVAAVRSSLGVDSAVDDLLLASYPGGLLPEGEPTVAQGRWCRRCAPRGDAEAEGGLDGEPLADVPVVTDAVRRACSVLDLEAPRLVQHNGHGELVTVMAGQPVVGVDSTAVATAAPKRVAFEVIRAVAATHDPRLTPRGEPAATYLLDRVALLVQGDLPWALAMVRDQPVRHLHLGAFAVSEELERSWPEPS